MSVTYWGQVDEPSREQMAAEKRQYEAKLEAKLKKTLQQAFKEAVEESGDRTVAIFYDRIAPLVDTALDKALKKSF